MHLHHGVLGVLVLLPAGAAQLASNIDPVLEHAWTENTGWTNWHDADGGSKGVIVGKSFLGGFAWGENVGWINLGDGAPANFVSYANLNGTDFGVNFNIVTGALTGLAWGENVGWINFTTGLPAAERATFDTSTHAFSGYAWGENIGWVNLGETATTLEAFDPATDLGFGKPGTGGLVPELRYYGLMSTGNLHVAVLRKSFPSVMTGWFVSLSANPVPFKGGMFVPVPILLSLNFPADANGMFVLQAPSGTGTVGFNVVLQVMIPDPGAFKGISLSNAIAVHFLP